MFTLSIEMFSNYNFDLLIEISLLKRDFGGGVDIKIGILNTNRMMVSLLKRGAITEKQNI